MTTPVGFPALLQRFFVQYLVNQRNLSKRTVAAYRDTFCLLLRFLQGQTGRMPASLTLADLSAANLLDFLEHIEQERGNAPRTRNARLAAIRTFLHYASRQAPEELPGIQQALAIPMKRFERPLVGFLSREEIQAILDAPDLSTWSGRRDRVLWMVMYNTGARVSETAALMVKDVCLPHPGSLAILGKGRKHRTVPMWKRTGSLLKEWLKETDKYGEAPLFPSARGHPMTRSGIAQRLRLAVRTAVELCPELAARRVSPHTLRHTTAMHLLQAGVAMPVIALWLGHETTETTHMYLEADLAMKEAALEKLQEPAAAFKRYKPNDSLLGFLESL